jgi:hypothetical protein
MQKNALVKRRNRKICRYSESIILKNILRRVQFFKRKEFLINVQEFLVESPLNEECRTYLIYQGNIIY